MLDAGLQRSGLPEVAAELHELGVGVVFRQRAETFEAPVAAAVVDVEDLVDDPQPSCGGRDLGVEGVDALLLVEQGDDD